MATVFKWIVDHLLGHRRSPTGFHPFDRYNNITEPVNMYQRFQPAFSFSPSHCEMYDLPYSNMTRAEVVTFTTDNHSEPEVHCRHGWTYDTSQYKTSISMDVRCYFLIAYVKNCLEKKCLFHNFSIHSHYYDYWWPDNTSNQDIRSHGSLTRYVKLWVAHAPGMSGTFSPPPTSKETAI